MATEYKVPTIVEPAPPKPNEVVLVTSGDLRHTANVMGWPAQQVLEQQIADVLAEIGWTVRRGHEYDPEVEHGFIWNQRMGMDIFAGIHPDTPIIIAEAVWEYSHHVLSGLKTQRGPILTAANWSGEWPGLVGLLNLNASMTKAGVKYSTIWSEDFTDEWARKALQEWATSGTITSHDTSHVRPLDAAALPADEAALGRALAAELQQKGAVMGIFDEGCMGMYNAIFDDEYINPLGIFKERLSQSALYYRMTTVSDEEAEAVFRWLLDRGVTFDFGPDEETDLTKAQVLAAVQDVHRRAAHRRRLRLRRRRHPVPAGPQGPGAGFRPGRRPAQRAGSPAGVLRGRPRALSRAAPAPLQRGRLGLRRGRAHHQPGVDGHGPQPLHQPPRRALGRSLG